MSEVARGLVRHFLSFVGAVLVTLGYMTEDSVASMLQSVETLLGLLVSTGAIAWSVYEKKVT